MTHCHTPVTLTAFVDLAFSANFGLCVSYKQIKLTQIKTYKLIRIDTAFAYIIRTIEQRLAKIYWWAII